MPMSLEPSVSDQRAWQYLLCKKKKKLTDSWCSDLYLCCRSRHLSPAPAHKDILTAVVSMPILTVPLPHMGQRWNECLACSPWLTAGQAWQHDASNPRNSFSGGYVQGFPYLLQMVGSPDACA